MQKSYFLSIQAGTLQAHFCSVLLNFEFTSVFMVTVKYCPVLICMQLQLLSDIFIFKYYRPLSGAILFFLCKTRDVLCQWLVHSNSPRVLK